MHTHGWVHGFSRRRFIGTALASGAALALPAMAPGVAQAKTDKTLPLAIAGGTHIRPAPGVDFFKHFYFPINPTPAGIQPTTIYGPTAPGDPTTFGDPATIRDFNGIVGGAEFPPNASVKGDPLGGKFWGADVRFMQGQFIDQAGNKHQGTLSFI